MDPTNAHRFALALAAGAVPALVVAADRPMVAEPRHYPVRPIRLVVPQAAGGSNDIMARSAAHYLTERLGKQVVVANRPGAEGIIGTEIVARAALDGYTFCLHRRHSP